MTKCFRCGLVSDYGELCKPCQIELTGQHVIELLGPPIDGLQGLGGSELQRHSMKGPRSKRKGRYRMSWGDWIALHKVGSVADVRQGIINQETRK